MNSGFTDLHHNEIRSTLLVFFVIGLLAVGFIIYSYYRLNRDSS